MVPTQAVDPDHLVKGPAPSEISREAHQTPRLVLPDGGPPWTAQIWLLVALRTDVPVTQERACAKPRYTRLACGGRFGVTPVSSAEQRLNAEPR
jgi:hypothetical protein